MPVEGVSPRLGVPVRRGERGAAVLAPTKRRCALVPNNPALSMLPLETVEWRVEACTGPGAAVTGAKMCFLELSCKPSGGARRCMALLVLCL